MGAQNFGGMQSAVDPDHGFAFVRQLVRLRVGKTFGVRQLLRDLLVIGRAS